LRRIRPEVSKLRAWLVRVIRDVQRLASEVGSVQKICLEIA
jgi:hypothetical protein